MANMSYCRFQNTVNDLRDCYWAIEEAVNQDEMSVSEYMATLSKDEQYALKRMIELCHNITEMTESAYVGED